MKRRRHRPALIAFVVIAAAACLALGWWQWGRFESSAGSARNLGYAMQWPLFAVAFVWGYKRFVQLEDEAELQDRLVAEGEDPVEPPGPASDAGAPRAAGVRTTEPSSATLTAIPEGFLPSRAPAPSAPDAAPDDPAHDEYNRLLAELAGSEQTEETK
ncbi:transcriptional regulator [Tsukamurella paurometabola]|uniref:Transcriptional regulator n=1 Tax=Tsukamurella paurometabola TaxID=2061 RepID=A0ABS5NIX2_TSUPA|nr:transcriptional regulator [Tsukamurella paurometabola]MBS4104254.1 transcriptional regulator [Tsukamurella paurometabola]